MLISFLDTPSEWQLNANDLIDILQTSLSQACILRAQKERFKLRKRKAAPASSDLAWHCQLGIAVARSWPEPDRQASLPSCWTRSSQSTVRRGRFVTMQKRDTKQDGSAILSTHNQNKVTAQTTGIPNTPLSCLLWVSTASLPITALACLCTPLLSRTGF